VPRELFAVERMHLKPLPAWIPEVYRLHQRTVSDRSTRQLLNRLARLDVLLIDEFWERSARWHTSHR
jgi:hypothetical protein